MEVYCASIEKAAESWKLIQSDPNYYVTFGEALFRRIFEIKPSAVGLFHFAAGGKKSETVDDFKSSPKFHPHASAVLKMLERAMVMMLEHKLYDLGEALASLGVRHVVYGVTKEHFKVLETAILDTLEESLGDHWTKQLRKDWEGVLKFVCTGMIVGSERGFSIKKKDRELGELSVSILRLQPTPSESSPAKVTGNRFDFSYLKSPNEGPPKPACRSRFEGFFEDSLPKTPKRRSIPKRNSDSGVKQIPSLLVLETPTRRKSPRRHMSTSTSTDLRDAVAAAKLKVDRLILPFSPSPDPKSLLLKNEILDIGLGPPAAHPMIRKKRPGKKKKDRALSDEPNHHNSITFEQLDASTSSWPILGLDDAPPTSNASWPILGLEPDATPVLPRRQLSPKLTKKKMKTPEASKQVVEKSLEQCAH
mmetsp:Transcript_18784/g.46537  ORF Transcript_18784/g.46537 Transcript_18784/m.46537 type:complete len:420 (+) Transcript_18784:33-1292(+)